MDPQPVITPEIQRLIRMAEMSRAAMGSEICHLKHKLNVPARLCDSLKHHPTAWLFGSAASGFAARLLFRRRSPAAKPRRGLAGALLGLTLTASRPLAKAWLANQLSKWAGKTTVRRH